MAAGVLIKAFDGDGWLRGHPIIILPASWEWGKAEGDPTVSYLVFITDREPEDLHSYLDPLYDLTAVPDPETGEYPILSPRRWRAQDTPEEWQEELARTGKIERTWEEVEPFVKEQDG